MRYPTTMNTLVIPTKRLAVITGLFFIAATVTAIIGLQLYMPVLHHADPLGAASTHVRQLALGAFFEALLCVANIGTAFMMLPVLSGVSWRLGPAYTIFRSLEVVLILVGLVSMLALSSVSQQFTAEGAHDPADYKAIGAAFIAVHDWTFIMGPHFMLGINTLIYSYLFHRSGLVPRLLAKLGMIGALLILMAAILEIFGMIGAYSDTTMLMALPIAVYEMVLAGRLIIKGFNTLDPAV